MTAAVIRLCTGRANSKRRHRRQNPVPPPDVETRSRCWSFRSTPPITSPSTATTSSTASGWRATRRFPGEDRQPGTGNHHARRYRRLGQTDRCGAERRNDRLFRCRRRRDRPCGGEGRRHQSQQYARYPHRSGRRPRPGAVAGGDAEDTGGRCTGPQRQLEVCGPAVDDADRRQDARHPRAWPHRPRGRQARRSVRHDDRLLQHEARGRIRATHTIGPFANSPPPPMY